MCVAGLDPQRPPVVSGISADDFRDNAYHMGDELPRDFPQIVANVIDRCLRAGRTDIDGLARTLGIGPRTLQRRLGHRSTTYRDMLCDRRIPRACELLAEADVSVRQVALAVGYATTPQFTRAFKTHVGKTPQQYREMLNQRPDLLLDR